MVEFIESTAFSVAVISTSDSWVLRQAQEPLVEGLNERYTHYFWDSPLIIIFIFKGAGSSCLASFITTEELHLCLQNLPV